MKWDFHVWVKRVDFYKGAKFLLKKTTYFEAYERVVVRNGLQESKNDVEKCNYELSVSWSNLASKLFFLFFLSFCSHTIMATLGISGLASDISVRFAWFERRKITHLS